MCAFVIRKKGDQPMYKDMTKQELQDAYKGLSEQMDSFKKMNLNLDMSRGKPGMDQLDLSLPLINCLSMGDYKTESGVDCRNYGVLDGIPEMKKIFADILEVNNAEIIVGGNSSLSFMFDNMAVNMTHGVRDGIPWSKQGIVKFLCPVPGYDRHFAICEYFHIEMIPVEMNEYGPDMDKVEELVQSDPMIKGMWCVPVYANPSGCIYSDETVRRIANLKPAADDFRLYWDNAYGVHTFEGERPHILNIIRECEKAGNPHMPLEFISFSKISFSGSAVAAMASSASNCEYIRKRLAVQTIGHDKLNQLRHVRFFKDAEGVYRHMEKHGDLIRPKFHIVLEALEKNLGGKGIASWTKPSGGYFISFNLMDGCAKRTVALCKEAGLVTTGAGAAYPYGNDPKDSNIRIAPTYPPIEELKTAMDIFTTAAQMAAVEKLLMA